MYEDINFIAIDFETATGYCHSVCEVGICVVKGGEIIETRSWLVRPENNFYWYRNIEVHGIKSIDTRNSPSFPEVWRKVEEYISETPILVAHNAGFDMRCIRDSILYFNMPRVEYTHYCTLRAARHLYKFEHYNLNFLCDELSVPHGKHHRAGDDAEMCAKVFLREIADANAATLDEMKFCSGKIDYTVKSKTSK